MSKNISSLSSPLPDSSKLKIGKIIGFQGLKGVLKLSLNTNNPSLFLTVEDLTFRLVNGQEETAQAKSMRINKHIIELLLKQYSTRSTVEHLLHAEVFAKRSQIAALSENEWWVRDLIGMKAFTTDGVFIGTICDVLGKDSQLLEIKRAAEDSPKTILIPFVRPLVPQVDTKVGKIVVVNLPGLFD